MGRNGGRARCPHRAARVMRGGNGGRTQGEAGVGDNGACGEAGAAKWRLPGTGVWNLGLGVVYGCMQVGFAIVDKKLRNRLFFYPKEAIFALARFLLYGEARTFARRVILFSVAHCPFSPVFPKTSIFYFYDENPFTLADIRLFCFCRDADGFAGPRVDEYGCDGSGKRFGSGFCGS